jgi:hypothetical protein
MREGLHLYRERLQKLGLDPHDPVYAANDPDRPRFPNKFHLPEDPLALPVPLQYHSPVPAEDGEATPAPAPLYYFPEHELLTLLVQLLLGVVRDTSQQK